MFTRKRFLRAGVGGIAIGLLGLLGAAPAQAVHESTDVSVTKTASPAGPVSGGDQITYTITVTNNNPNSTTEEITLTDVIPAGTTFVSLVGTFPSNAFQFPGDPATCTTPSPGAGGTVTCTGFLGGPGLFVEDTSATFTLVVQVEANAQDPITNTASVTLLDDPDTTNNTATVVTNVTPTQGIRPGKGCGDKNHIHEREAECKKPAR